MSPRSMSTRLHRAVRHALVHLSAADLLRGDQAAARRVPPRLVWLAAAALEIAPIETGWTAIDEFAARFVYFYTGYLFAPHIFALRGSACRRGPDRAAPGLAAWAPRQRRAGLRRALPSCRSSRSRSGSSAPAAVVAISALMAKSELFEPLRYCGQQLDRHLSRLLPADGGERARCCSRPASSPMSARCRSWSRSPASSARSRCSGRCARTGALPVRAARPVPDRARRASPCSRRSSHERVIPGRASSREPGTQTACHPHRSTEFRVRARARPGMTAQFFPALQLLPRPVAIRPRTLHIAGMPPISRTPSKGDHVFLVDGSSYIFRAYHALPPLTRKSDGLQLNAVYGFCNMLWKLLRDMKPEERPTHLAVVFDKSEKTFRNELYPDYKAHRPDPPDDLIPAVPADPRGGARLRPAVPGAGRLRGRRPDRDLCARGLRGRRQLHHRVVRQGPDAARERLRRHVRHHEGRRSAPPR